MFLPRSKKLHWTFHAISKMAYYKLSKQRVRRVLNSPKRVEEGIAPGTTALMQPAALKRTTRGGEDWNHEIWVMIQVPTPRRGRGSDRSVGKEIRIISAWRYPGKTKPRSEAIKEAIMSAYNEYMSSDKSAKFCE